MRADIFYWIAAALFAVAGIIFGIIAAAHGPAMYWVTAALFVFGAGLMATAALLTARARRRQR